MALKFIFKKVCFLESFNAKNKCTVLHQLFIKGCKTVQTQRNTKTSPFTCWGVQDCAFDNYN